VVRTKCTTHVRAVPWGQIAMIATGGHPLGNSGDAISWRLPHLVWGVHARSD